MKHSEQCNILSVNFTDNENEYSSSNPHSKWSLSCSNCFIPEARLVATGYETLRIAKHIAMQNGMEENNYTAVIRCFKFIITAMLTSKIIG